MYWNERVTNWTGSARCGWNLRLEHGAGVSGLESVRFSGTESCILRTCVYRKVDLFRKA
jgi:hypothetical protein